MSKYKMIALAYNKISESKGTVVAEKIFDTSKGFIQPTDRVVMSRYTKVLQDIEKIKSSGIAEGVVVVFRLNYNIHKPAEHDAFLGRVDLAVRGTNITPVVLLAFEQLREFHNLQDFHCDYGTDGGPEMYFDLIAAEEEYENEVIVHLLKNRCGGLYVL